MEACPIVGPWENLPYHMTIISNGSLSLPGGPTGIIRADGNFISFVRISIWKKINLVARLSE
jgi:hypothetical protein